MTIDEISAAQLFAVFAVVSAVGVFIPFFLVRLCRKRWDQSTWLGKTVIYLICVSYLIPLGLNFYFAGDLTVKELTPLQFLAIGCLGCSFAVYMPLAFLQTYQESWHEWPWQTKTYFACFALALPGSWVAGTYFALSA